MKTITEQSEIEIAFAEFEPCEDGAFATCRLIEGAESANDPQEWAEHGEINGVPAKVYYIFSGEDTTHEETDFMPWDTEHVSKIEIDN